MSYRRSWCAGARQQSRCNSAPRKNIPSPGGKKLFTGWRGNVYLPFIHLYRLEKFTCSSVLFFLVRKGKESWFVFFRVPRDESF